MWFALSSAFLAHLYLLFSGMLIQKHRRVSFKLTCILCVVHDRINLRGMLFARSEPSPRSLRMIHGGWKVQTNIRC